LFAPIITDEDAATWADRLNVEPLLEVEGGTLYRNLDAAIAPHERRICYNQRRNARSHKEAR